MIGKLLLLFCVSCLVFMPLKSHSADEAGINQFLASNNREQASNPSGKESVQQQSSTNPKEQHPKEQHMELGNFSIGLAVKDIEASRDFYEKFGFKVFMGDAAQKWLIMRVAITRLGFFKGCQKRTFSPVPNALRDRANSVKCD